MLEGKLRFADYRDSFYDEFGNRINNYIIEKYCKNGNNEWFLGEIIKTFNTGIYFVVNDKPYFECNGSLLPLNIDFESENYGCCYKVVDKDITEYKRIIGNEYLCENKYLGLRLHRQDYSDGTCFYTLQDDRSQWPVDYGNHDLSKLIKVLESKIENDEKYASIFPHTQEQVKQIIREQINHTKKLIEDIKRYI